MQSAIISLENKKSAITKSSAASNEFENKISAASFDTQMSILNEAIVPYQRLLFELNRSSTSAKVETPKITRIKEGLAVLADTIGNIYQSADGMSYKQFVDHQISKLPDELKSNPDICGDIAASYFIFNLGGNIAKGLGAAYTVLDDATGNMLSWAAHKLADGAEMVGGFIEEKLTSLDIPTVVAQNTADIGEIATHIFAPGTLGKVAKTAAGVMKFRGSILQAVTKNSMRVLDGKEIGMSWAANWFERGYAYEKYLEGVFKGAKLPYGFKTFDFFTEGRAISVKTLDTNTLARIANPDLVRYTINGYINKMIDFTEYRGKLTAADVATKELHLAIPYNVPTAEHARKLAEQIAHSIQYGADNGVKVIITKVK